MDGDWGNAKIIRSIPPLGSQTYFRDGGSAYDEWRVVVILGGLQARDHRYFYNKLIYK